MKISTKGRYGLRAMADLAINSTKGHVDLKNISIRQQISKSYLEQLFSSLKKSNLVKSIKGPQGGYLLAKSVSEITVGDILRALEGNLSVIDETTLISEDKSPLKYCIYNNVWVNINNAINEIVDNITLEFIVNEYKKIEFNDEPLEYYI